MVKRLIRWFIREFDPDDLNEYSSKLERQKSELEGELAIRTNEVRDLTQRVQDVTDLWKNAERMWKQGFPPEFTAMLTYRFINQPVLHVHPFQVSRFDPPHKPAQDCHSSQRVEGICLSTTVFVTTSEEVPNMRIRDLLVQSLLESDNVLEEIQNCRVEGRTI